MNGRKERTRFLGCALVVLLTAGQALGWQALPAKDAMSRQLYIHPRYVPLATPTPDCVANMEPMTNPSPPGPVMTSFTAYLIFWLPSGVHFESSAAGDMNYEQLLQRYFDDVGGSSFYDILSQYAGSNGIPSATVSIGGMIVDTTKYPRAGTTKDPLLDSDVTDEILNVINAQSWPVGLDTMYFVYTGRDVQSCTDTTRSCCTFTTASSTGYCAYHSAFEVVDTGNQPFPVIYANMPNALSIAPRGECGLASPNGDTSADTEIALTSHEHFEAVSDPLADAWGDADGCEVADKCDLPFNTSQPDILLNGHPYYVPEEWSNAAGGCTLSGPPAPTATTSPAGTPTPSPQPTATATDGAASCVGDCNVDGKVGVDELVKGVNIALGVLQLSVCTEVDCNNNGHVTVDCLVKAANNALNGCGH